MTQDERFLIEVYKEVEGKTSSTLDPKTVGEKLGVKEKRLKTLLQGLFQANFLKKHEEGLVSLTERGLSLAEELL